MSDRCMALHHNPNRPPKATHVCEGESWQDKTLYLCRWCAKSHTEDTHHEVRKLAASDEASPARAGRSTGNG